MSSFQKHVAVIGGGPAGLMAAQGLAHGGVKVTVIERMPSVARKFLMAGRGGLNLTHSEPMEAFYGRYGQTDARLLGAIQAFPPRTQIKWAEGLGQETFIGTSGRVFPKAMKASPLLRAWLARLDKQGVMIRTRTSWQGFAADGAVLLQAEGAGAPTSERFDAVVLAVGGASWPRLGADGAWVKTLAADGLPITPLEPANAGVTLDWSDVLKTRHAGQPLKRIELTVGGDAFRGEAVITRDGLEGGVIYAANEAIRRALADGPARVVIDLRPDVRPDLIAQRLAHASAKDSLSNRLRKAGALLPAAIGVLHEGHKPLPRDPQQIAAAIKAVPLTITGFSGLARAISTAGGLQFSALDARWMLASRPGVFAAGEMLDWTAPTGGYLLTACLATGRAAAEGCLAWLEDKAV